MQEARVQIIFPRSMIPTSMAGEALADSDFFIALYKSNDTNHKRAVDLLEKIKERNVGIAITSFVYAEIVTVLSIRVSKITARHFMDDVESTGVRVIHTVDEVFERSKEVFRSQRSKNISFTDVTNIAFARAEGFDSIISFDKHYSKNNLPLFR